MPIKWYSKQDRDKNLNFYSFIASVEDTNNKKKIRCFFKIIKTSWTVKLSVFIYFWGTLKYYFLFIHKSLWSSTWGDSSEPINFVLIIFIICFKKKSQKGNRNNNNTREISCRNENLNNKSRQPSIKIQFQAFTTSTSILTNADINLTL